MFDIPGFDPKSMSEEELQSKYTDLSRRINWAARFGSMDIAGQLNAMMLAIETEQRERILSTLWDERQRVFPEVIETEPDLVEKPVQQEDDNRPRPRRIQTSRSRNLSITKTSAPSTPNGRRGPIKSNPTGNKK